MLRRKKHSNISVIYISCYDTMGANMNLRIKQGDLEVLASGTIHINNNESTIITIDDALNIKISYVDDEENPEQKINSRAIGKEVFLELRNFNNPLGTATKKPLSIAKMNDKTLGLSFSVVAIGECKVLSYTIYLGQ